ncbi:hypothetical protein THMIRHAS_17040 [Thiosulfatimonas sediminis]|uniref:Uncharacterized protein n=1 Tax=Thiosulfatimonas sediminis TaxID=2675054 RepID=A0A6F8PW27_9GAMM|nr:hypothetical protein THMIRHAS_17040 [Thiosulfatimonas sediminis]
MMLWDASLVKGQAGDREGFRPSEKPRENIWYGLRIDRQAGYLQSDPQRRLRVLTEVSKGSG